MFKVCRALTSVDLSNFVVEKVKEVKNMFANCTNLNYIDISPFEFKKMEKMEMFNNLTETGHIKIKKSLYKQIEKFIPKKWEVSLI